MAIWWRHNILFAKIMHVFNISHSMAFRILNKIWGYPGFLRSYNGLKKGMFLPIFCIILPIAARADFRLWCARTALWKVKSDCKWMEIVNYGKRNPNHANILNFDFICALCARTTRAWTGTDGKFWNALNDLVRTQNCLYVILSIVKFWRARTCASWRARGQGLSVCCLMTWSLCVLNLVNLRWNLMNIWMITWNHKMAPRWRHGWVITLTKLPFRFLIMARILWKFEDDSHRNFWDNLATNFSRNKHKGKE